VSSAETIERERRWATPAALGTFAAVAMVVVGVVLNTSALDYHNNKTLLESAHSHSTEIIIAGFVQAIGFALFCAPLVYLFRAAQVRSDRVKRELILFCVLGPVLFAIQSVLAAIVTTHLGSDFAAGTVTTGKAGVHAAKHLLDDSGGQKTANALRLAAGLALLVGVAYPSLQAMRVGLLTRFFGAFGVALGVSLVLVPFGAVLLLIWLTYLGLLIAGWVRGGRPPAWESGEAIPWPSPGERMAEQMSGEGEEGGGEITADESEPANPPRQPGERRKRKRRSDA
jgi:hypothetical protein